MTNRRNAAILILTGLLCTMACAGGSLPAGGDWTQLKIDRRARNVRVLDAKGQLVLTAHPEPFDASLDGVAFSLERDALVVDAARAMETSSLRKIVFVTPNFNPDAFRDRVCGVIASISAARRGARASIFYEGQTATRRHYYESRRILLATFRRDYRLTANVPDDVKSLHLRFDLQDPAGGAVRFHTFTFAPVAELPEPPKPSTEKPQLVFRADFDGSADATFARGEAKALVVKNLAFAPGKRGQALRVTNGMKPLLTFAAKGNVVPERGTVAMWVKREWPDDGLAKDGSRPYRMLFTTPIPRPRNGSGALFAWFHGPNFRGDQSDLDDSHVERYPIAEGWMHLAMSWDEFGVRLAINGRYPASGGCGDSDSELKRAIENPDGLGFDRVPFDRFSVGSRDGQYAFDGLIDDFRIYSAPLNEAELAALYRELATADDGKIAPSDFARLCAGPNPHVGGDRLDLDLVESIRLDSADAVEALRAAGRFNLVGDQTFGSLAGRGYFECSGREGSRFALRLECDPAREPLWCVEIDYPDDKLRTMDLIVQDAKDGRSDYGLQVGVAAGDEWPNTRKMLTHRCLLWPRAKTLALVAMTARADAPAAVSEVRVYRVRGSKLPPLKVREPKPNAEGWRRHFALYFEDPAIGYDFAAPTQGSTAETQPILMDRVIADMKYTGETMFSYPAVWYQGLIGDGYIPRLHTPDYRIGWYERFDREGLYLMPTMNPNNMPVPHGLITRTSISDGSLHDSPVSIHDTGLPNCGGWHGTPPNFNIAHPDTQKWLEGLVDTLVAEGLPHPSFKGLCLHITRHGMLTFGGIEAGYNDYCIAAFERAKGVRVDVSRTDPMRGRLYAAWLKAHPDAYEKWLDWRGDVVATFWGRIARKLQAARGDLKLWLNPSSVARVAHADFLKDDFARRVNREMGLDAAKLRAAAGNLIVGQTIVPADYRWRKPNDFPKDNRETYRAKQRDLYRLTRTWDLVQGQAFPWAGQHDRYWESAIGATGSNGGDWKNYKNKNARNSLDSAWMKECTWRVSTINPSGRHALAHFAAPLLAGDILGMSKGGFLIGTYGMEDELREFMAAYLALPAVVMADAAPARDGVVLRQADFDGKSYFYLCNTSGEPRRVAVEFPAGSASLAGPDAVPSGTVELKPYELRSYEAPAGKPSWN